MKTCFKCNSKLPESEFYKHPQMADGLLGKCKACTRRDSIENRNKNLDKYTEYDRNRAMLPHRVECRNKYRETLAAKESKRRSVLRCKVKFPSRYAARNAVAVAIKNGSLVRMPCEVCGCQKSQGHHDDYSKPLSVRWLCSKHHREWHRHNEPLDIQSVLSVAGDNEEVASVT